MLLVEMIGLIDDFCNFFDLILCNANQAKNFFHTSYYISDINLI